MGGGSYAVFILGAYGSAVAIIVGLIVWIMLDRRHLLRSISELEGQGATRRCQPAYEESP